jgi:hypothetical protein
LGQFTSPEGVVVRKSNLGRKKTDRKNQSLSELSHFELLHSHVTKSELKQKETNERYN